MLVSTSISVLSNDWRQNNLPLSLVTLNLAFQIADSKQAEEPGTEKAEHTHETQSTDKFSNVHLHWTSSVITNIHGKKYMSNPNAPPAVAAVIFFALLHSVMKNPLRQLNFSFRPPPKWANGFLTWEKHTSLCVHVCLLYLVDGNH